MRSPSSLTWTGRRYRSSRLHFATSLDLALTYIESVATGGPALIGITVKGIAALREWDIYVVSTGSETYRMDVEMTGAVWITEDVPPPRIRRLNMFMLRARMCLHRLFERLA